MIGLNRVRFISMSHGLSSKYRWGPTDTELPIVPKDISKNVTKQNIPAVNANPNSMNFNLDEIQLGDRKYLNRGAATDHSAKMTV